MISCNFPQANCTFGPPPDLTDSQCGTIYAYKGKIEGGSLDGVQIVTVAWKPDEKELADLMAGKPLFLSVIGGLPPHLLATDFQLATHPA